jgi:hypothetical protein
MKAMLPGEESLKKKPITVAIGSFEAIVDFPYNINNFVYLY